MKGLNDISEKQIVLDKAILKKCLPHATEININLYGDRLISAMAKYEINTNRRQAAFLSQIAHESGSLRYVEEIASGEAYEGRKDLGNTEPGDGIKFKGRGLIQITGRHNYGEVGRELGYDFINNPENLTKPGAACYSSAWFWNVKGLNRLADIDAFEKITRRINGGLNGIEDRLKHWVICKEALRVV